MKQYKLTSQDIVGPTKDAAVPDAYIDPNDPVLKMFGEQILNPLAKHFASKVQDKDNDKKS